MKKHITITYLLVPDSLCPEDETGPVQNNGKQEQQGDRQTHVMSVPDLLLLHP